jgi:hypothetical protein
MAPEQHTADLLDKLCVLFDDELERQENVLRLCVAQGAAARAHDVGVLEARTAALTALLDEEAESEPRRLELFGALVRVYELPLERQTLTHLIATIPEPWRRHASEFQSRVREVLEESQRTVRRNTRAMRRSSRMASAAVEALAGAAGAPGRGYDAGGVESASYIAPSAGMDARG